MLTIFGKKKPYNIHGLPTQVYNFLEDADEAYIKAFETRSVTHCHKYFERQCVRGLHAWVTQQATKRYFASEKYRLTEWKLKAENETHMWFYKKCEFKMIRVLLFKKIKPAEDYAEEWVVAKDPERGLQVVSIRFIAEGFELQAYGYERD